MGSVFFVLLCLIAPPFLLWRAIVVQRRVRAMPRKQQADEEIPVEPAYTDDVRGVDGLTYSKSHQFNPELLAATRRGNEPDGIKDLEGRR